MIVNGKVKLIKDSNRLSKSWLTVGLTTATLGITAFLNIPTTTVSADTVANPEQSAEAEKSATPTAITTLRTSAPTTEESSTNTGSSKLTNTLAESADNTTDSSKVNNMAADTLKPSSTTSKAGQYVVASNDKSSTESQSNITNLGSTTTAGFETAQKVASEKYATTGVPQTITGSEPSATENQNVSLIYLDEDGHIVSQGTKQMTNDDFTQSANNFKATDKTPTLDGYVIDRVTPFVKLNGDSGDTVAIPILDANNQAATVTVPYPALAITVVKNQVNVVIDYYKPTDVNSKTTTTIIDAWGNTKTSTTTTTQVMASATGTMSGTDALNYQYVQGDLVDANVPAGFQVVKVDHNLRSDTLFLDVEVQPTTPGFSKTETIGHGYYDAQGNEISPNSSSATFTNGILLSLPVLLQSNDVITSEADGATIDLGQSKVVISLDGQSKTLSLSDYLKDAVGAGLDATDSELTQINQMAQQALANSNGTLKLIYGLSPLLSNNALQTAYEKAIASHNQADIYDFLARAAYVNEPTTLQVGGNESSWQAEYIAQSQGVLPDTDPQVKTEVGDAVSVTPDDYYDNTVQGTLPDTDPQVKTQVGDAIFVTPEDYYDNSNNDFENGGAGSTTPTNSNAQSTTPSESGGSTTGTLSNNEVSQNKGTAITPVNGNNKTNQQANGQSLTITSQRTKLQPKTVATQVGKTTQNKQNKQIHQPTLPQTNEASQFHVATVSALLLAALGGLLGVSVSRRKKD